MVDSALLCERNWVRVLCMPFMCYLVVIILNICDHVVG